MPKEQPKIEEGLGSWVDVFDVEGVLKERVWIPYPTQCPLNCPGGHTHDERKELGPPHIGGRRK